MRKTTAYRFDLMDAQGINHVVLIGTEDIAVIEETRELKNLISLFPVIVDEAKLVFNKPYVAVHVPIRMASRLLHCKDGLEVGEMRRNKSLFYPGWVQTGSITVPQALTSQAQARMDV